jgi:hypothetical protein
MIILTPIRRRATEKLTLAHLRSAQDYLLGGPEAMRMSGEVAEIGDHVAATLHDRGRIWVLGGAQSIRTSPRSRRRTPSRLPLRAKARRDYRQDVPSPAREITAGRYRCVAQSVAGRIEPAEGSAPIAALKGGQPRRKADRSVEVADGSPRGAARAAVDCGSRSVG